MSKFDTNKRSLEPNWLIEQIKLLIYSAKVLSNSSLVIYAALETRNLFERIEFELLASAVKEIQTEEFLRDIRGKNGIDQANKKYKNLKYRYQSFSSAATKAIFDEGCLMKYDLKKSDQFCNNLAQYIHAYTQNPEDMVFGSHFINSGIELIEKSIDYLIAEFFVIIDGGLTYGVFDFQSFPPSVKKEFENWLKAVDEDEEALIKRLIEINNREFNGKKIKLRFLG